MEGRVAWRYRNPADVGTRVPGSNSYRRKTWETAAEYFVQMGGIAVGMAERVQTAVMTGDVEQARLVQDGDEVMNDLHRRLLCLLTDRRWPHGTVAATDVVLLGRFYERFADHAVGIARRIVFQTTGHPPLRHDDPPITVINR